MQNKNQKAVRALSNALHGTNLSKAEYIRIQAVLLKKKGYAIKQIVDIAEKSEDAIQEWITAYNQNGIGGLRTKQRDTSSRSTLTQSNKRHIKELMTGHKPSDYGYSDDFWSVPSVKRLVKDQYQVEYKNDRSYRKLLRFCGFSYQKAEYIDHRKDKGEKAHFKKRLQKRLKKGGFSMWW